MRPQKISDFRILEFKQRKEMLTVLNIPHSILFLCLFLNWNKFVTSTIFTLLNKIFQNKKCETFLGRLVTCIKVSSNDTQYIWSKMTNWVLHTLNPCHLECMLSLKQKRCGTKHSNSKIHVNISYILSFIQIGAHNIICNYTFIL